MASEESSSGSTAVSQRELIPHNPVADSPVAVAVSIQPVTTSSAAPRTNITPKPVNVQTKAHSKWDMEEDINLNICFFICFSLCMILAFVLYFVVYKNQAHDGRYATGICTVINTSIVSQCYTNYCDFYCHVDVMYIGEIKKIERVFTVHTTTNQTQAQLYLNKKYPINDEIKCYYPIKENIPLELSKPVRKGDAHTTYIWSIIFFVLSGIFGLIIVVSMVVFVYNCMKHRPKSSNTNATVESSSKIDV
jgi:heme/copper-type cytochrome/quinol oxidase subunit 2